MELDLTLDLEKLLSAKGLAFDVSFSWASGRNLSESIGNVFQVAEIYVDMQPRLARLYIEQSLASDRLSIKFGRVSAGNDFAALPVFAFSVNAAANGNPVGISINDPGFFADPIAQWGLRALFKVSEVTHFRAGAYLSDPEVGDSSNNGLDFSFNPGRGVLSIGEVTLNSRQGSGVWGLPGQYRFGAYYDSADFAELADPSRQESGQYGWYATIQQQVTREKDSEEEEEIHPLFGRHIVRNRHVQRAPKFSQGLTAWFSVVSSPKEKISPMPLQLNGGLIYHGLFAHRPRDKAGVWVLYGRFSEDLPDQDVETVLQLTYAIHATPWLYVTPNIQYVIHTDGRSEIANAFVGGGEIGATF